MATNIELLQQLYVAYYNRPADVPGMNYYLPLLDKGASIADVAKSFGTAQEYKDTYAGMKPDGIIDAIYMNLFGRHADKVGLDFWGSALAANPASISNIVEKIAAGALNTDGTLNGDGVAYKNKVDAAIAFTKEIDAPGNELERVAYTEGKKSVLEAAKAYIASVTADPATLTAAVAGVHAVGQQLVELNTPAVNTTLTDGVDKVVGGLGNDVITATDKTFTALDTIDGAGGKNTLNISDTSTNGIDLSLASVKNVQTATVQSTTGLLGNAGNVAGWTGLETVTFSLRDGVDRQTVTAADTTKVVLNNTIGSTVIGGSSIEVNATGTAAAGSLVTSTAAASTAANTASTAANTASTNAATLATAAGTLNTAVAAAANMTDVATLTAAAVTAGTITAAQKTSIDAAANVAAAAALTAPIATAATTAATAAAAAAATAATAATNAAADAAAAAAAVVNYNITATNNAALSNAVIKGGNLVQVADGSTAGTQLKSVSLDGNLGAATLSGGALTTVSVANTNQNVTISNATVDHALTLNLNKVAGGTIADAVAKTLTVNSTGAASTGLTISAAAATAVTFAGDKAVTATLNAALATSVTLTGAGGFNGTLVNVAADAAITATGSSGANTVTIGANQSYAGGSGVDTVTITAVPTKAINGGAGTADELVINVASGVFSAPSGNTLITGFETLGLGAQAQGNYDATGFTNLHSAATAAAVAFSNVAAGTGLLIDGTSTGGVTYTLKDATGSADTLNLTLKSSGALTAGSVTASGIETVKITVTDTNSTAHTDSLTLVDAEAKSIVVTGNAGLTLTNTTAVAVTSFDASGVTATGAAGGVSYTSANTSATAAVSIKGGAGNDILNGSVSVDTIVGGAGDDQIASGSGLDIVTGGTGADTFILARNANGNVYTTITDFTKGTGGDTINLSGLETGANAAVTALGAKLNLASTAAFADFLAAGAAGHATAVTNAVVSWFQFGGDTYIVVDNNNADVFTNSATTGDQVVKLTGLIDLSTAAITVGGLLTVA